MNAYTTNGNRGFTLIELFVALAVLAVLLSIAGPAMQHIAARSDIKQATDQVLQAFRTAKQAARVSNSSVTVNLTTGDSDNSISFAIVADTGMSLPVMTLPGKISVSGDTAVFTFNSMGMIDSTDTISLASTLDSQHASTIVINNTMGHVTDSFAALGGEGS